MQERPEPIKLIKENQQTTAETGNFRRLSENCRNDNNGGVSRHFLDDSNSKFLKSATIVCVCLPLSCSF